MPQSGRSTASITLGFGVTPHALITLPHATADLSKFAWAWVEFVSNSINSSVVKAGGGVIPRPRADLSERVAANLLKDEKSLSTLIWAWVGVSGCFRRAKQRSDLVPFEANTVWWWRGFSDVSRGCCHAICQSGPCKRGHHQYM